MRYATGLVLTGLLGAAASLYTPSANAGVYLGVGVPVPVVAPRVVVGAPVAPAYYPYAPMRYAGYARPAYWGYGWGYHGYYHQGYAYHGWGYHHR